METTLKEIMILRNDVDGKTRLKIFQVDDNTLAKLRRIRGNLYADDPRLRTVADMPTMLPRTPEPVISPEMERRAAAAYARHVASQQAIQPQPPQPKRPKTPEELWRQDPALRSEFNNNLNAYLAYCTAVESGRCRVYGR